MRFAGQPASRRWCSFVRCRGQGRCGAAHVDVVVLGQIARDLVLVVDEVPDAGNSAAVRRHREMLGGKGANQAVGLARLGVRVALVGVVGADRIGEDLLRQARRDGIDVSRVVRREESGLIVDVLDGHGRWRYLEYLPEAVLLTGGDVAAASDLMKAARYVLVQLQQSKAAVAEAVRLAREAHCRVVLDGVPDRDPLPSADVLDTEVVDTTGAGDAFVAALTATLLHGGAIEEAARQAVRAAGLTVRHPGGRPELHSL